MGLGKGLDRLADGYLHEHGVGGQGVVVRRELHEHAEGLDAFGHSEFRVPRGGGARIQFDL